MLIKIRALIVLLFIVTFSICLYRVDSSNFIRTDLSDMLPHAKDVVASEYADRVSKNLIFLLSKDDTTKVNSSKNISSQNNNSKLESKKLSDELILELEAKSNELVKALQKINGIEVINSVDTKKLQEFYFKYKYSYMPFNFGKSFGNDNPIENDVKVQKALSNHILKNIFSPFSFISEMEIQYDPYLVVRNMLMNSNIQAYSVTNNGVIYVFDKKTDKPYFLIRGVVKDNKVSNELIEAVTLFESKIKQEGYEMLYTGSVFFANKAAESSKTDMTVIGVGSTIGVILLLFLYFRSIKPIIYGYSILVISLFYGLLLTLAVFGSIHVLSLSISTCLIGICFDYVLHLFIFKSNNDSCDSDISSPKYKLLGKSLFYGAISSVMAYFIMLITDMVVLAQMAVFAVGALFSTLLVVYFFGVAISFSKKQKEQTNKIENNDVVSRVVDKFANIPYVLLLTLSLVVISIGGYLYITVDKIDDVDAMQSLDKQLVHNDQFIQSVLNGDKQSSWFILETDSLDNSLRECEEFVSKLTKAEKKSLFAICDYVPSQRTQKQNISFYQNNFEKLEEIYLSQDIAIDKTKAIPVDLKTFTLEDYPNDLIVFTYNNSILLRANTNNTSLINKLIDNKYIRQLAPKENWNKAFKSFRTELDWILGVAIVVVSLLLFYVMKFKSLQLYTLSLLTGLSVGVVGNYFITGYFNLFTTLACFMILGLGADYAIFSYHSDKKTYPKVVTALFVACLTTLLSFGLLSLSDTRLVASLGIVLTFGLGTTYICCVLYKCVTEKEES
jgi:predicted exporter